MKNGGIVAFVTSAGTLDKKDEATRLMLADKSDFIGAIRLPGGKNGAFKDNAGTEVTTDIIFLQKHEDKSVDELSDIPDSLSVLSSRRKLWNTLKRLWKLLRCPLLKRQE